MKLHIASDLHQEFLPHHQPVVDADVVILAGDIHTKGRGLAWAAATFAQPVIYVLGNHEYYGKAIPKHVVDLKYAAQNTNVHVLERDVVVIDGVAFLGCTLWTDYRLFGDPRMAGHHASERLNDFRRIRVSPDYRRWRSLDAAVVHEKSRRWLRDSLAAISWDKRVVVTHHAPSPQSLHPAERPLLLSAAYASNLEAWIAESDIDLWVHGHTHYPCRYAIGATTVVSNPKGYPDQGDTARSFVPDLVVPL
ncbi:MAG: metallophosphoesterase [Candidatus Competibacterales bacterium]